MITLFQSFVLTIPLESEVCSKNVELLQYDSLSNGQAGIRESWHISFFGRSGAEVLFFISF